MAAVARKSDALRSLRNHRTESTRLVAPGQPSMDETYNSSRRMASGNPRWHSSPLASESRNPHRGWIRGPVTFVWHRGANDILASIARFLLANFGPRTLAYSRLASVRTALASPASSRELERIIEGMLLTSATMSDRPSTWSVITRCPNMSENHCRPSRQREDSGNTRRSSNTLGAMTDTYQPSSFAGESVRPGGPSHL